MLRSQIQLFVLISLLTPSFSYAEKDEENLTCAALAAARVVNLEQYRLVQFNLTAERNRQMRALLGDEELHTPSRQDLGPSAATEGQVVPFVKVPLAKKNPIPSPARAAVAQSVATSQPGSVGRFDSGSAAVDFEPRPRAQEEYLTMANWLHEFARTFDAALTSDRDVARFYKEWAELRDYISSVSNVKWEPPGARWNEILARTIETEKVMERVDFWDRLSHRGNPEPPREPGYEAIEMVRRGFISLQVHLEIDASYRTYILPDLRAINEGLGYMESGVQLTKLHELSPQFDLVINNRSLKLAIANWKFSPFSKEARTLGAEGERYLKAIKAFQDRLRASIARSSMPQN